MSTFNFTKALARRALEDPATKWQLQGFGMLRAYLPGDIRLHVWDNRFQVPDVTLIHDHPWDFESLIVAGRLLNERYEMGSQFAPHGGMPYWMRTIKPGVGLAQIQEDQRVELRLRNAETYFPGHIYYQRADEIHQTKFADGTVTIVQRVRGQRPDVARSFYEDGKQWVSAEPRDASPNEIAAIVDNALSAWF